MLGPEVVPVAEYVEVIGPPFIVQMRPSSVLYLQALPVIAKVAVPVCVPPIVDVLAVIFTATVPPSSHDALALMMSTPVTALNAEVPESRDMRVAYSAACALVICTGALPQPTSARKATRTSEFRNMCDPQGKRLTPATSTERRRHRHAGCAPPEQPKSSVSIAQMASCTSPLRNNSATTGNASWAFDCA